MRDGEKRNNGNTFQKNHKTCNRQTNTLLMEKAEDREVEKEEKR